MPVVAAGGGRGKGGSAEPSRPPGEKGKGGDAVRLAALLALVGAACASQPEPPCDSATAAGMAAACTLRVQTECVERGVPREECKLIDECDRAARERTERCGG